MRDKEKIKAYQAKYYEANKEKIKAYQAEYYAANKEKLKRLALSPANLLKKKLNKKLKQIELSTVKIKNKNR